MFTLLLTIEFQDYPLVMTHLTNTIDRTSKYKVVLKQRAASI